MASVASTYARAFADVVFDTHLDAARAIDGLRQIAALFNESIDLRRVWEIQPSLRIKSASCWTQLCSATGSRRPCVTWLQC